MTRPRDILLLVMERVGAALSMLVAASWIMRRLWAVFTSTAMLIESVVERILRWIE